MDKVKQAFKNFPQVKAVWYDQPNNQVYLSYNARPKLKKILRADFEKKTVNKSKQTTK